MPCPRKSCEQGMPHWRREKRPGRCGVVLRGTSEKGELIGRRPRANPAAHGSIIGVQLARNLVYFPATRMPKASEEGFAVRHGHLASPEGGGEGNGFFSADQI